jgi:hypothetical protein
MSKPKMVLGLLSAFVLGSATPHIASLVVPPAHASTGPQKWAYLCKLVHKEPAVNAAANELGQQGWELSAVDDGLWCFKRPL